MDQYDYIYSTPMSYVRTSEVYVIKNLIICMKIGYQNYQRLVNVVWG